MGKSAKKKRRMPLRERFRRLTLWNKLGAAGALASIVGVSVSLLSFLAIPGEPPDALADCAFDNGAAYAAEVATARLPGWQDLRLVQAFRYLPAGGHAPHIVAIGQGPHEASRRVAESVTVLVVLEGAPLILYMGGLESSETEASGVAVLCANKQSILITWEDTKSLLRGEVFRALPYGLDQVGTLEELLPRSCGDGSLQMTPAGEVLIRCDGLLATLSFKRGKLKTHEIEQASAGNQIKTLRIVRSGSEATEPFRIHVSGVPVSEIELSVGDTLWLIDERAPDGRTDLRLVGDAAMWRSDSVQTFIDAVAPGEAHLWSIFEELGIEIRVSRKRAF